MHNIREVRTSSKERRLAQAQAQAYRCRPVQPQGGKRSLSAPLPGALVVFRAS